MILPLDPTSERTRMDTIQLPMTPVGKPRMTQRDKWKQRPAVMRYRAYCDELRLRLGGRELPVPYHVVFYLPVPKSWSKKKQAAHVGQPHRQKPDKDNLEKALLDAIFPDDSHVWDGRVTKLWGWTGSIVIAPLKIEPLTAN